MRSTTNEALLKVYTTPEIADAVRAKAVESGASVSHYFRALALRDLQGEGRALSRADA